MFVRLFFVVPTVVAVAVLVLVVVAISFEM